MLGTVNATIVVMDKIGRELVAYQEMVHCTGPTLLSHPSQKPIVVFCAEGVEPRLLSEDEFLMIGSLSACTLKVSLQIKTRRYF